MKTWIVYDMIHPADDPYEVKAELCSVNHGCLEFDNGRGIFEAIAAGWWTHVRMKG